MHIRNIGFKSGLVACGIALLAPAAPAEVLLIDFGSDDSFRGASVASPDANGNHWTSVWSGAFFANIVDIDGNATAVDLGFSSAPGTDYFNGPSGATQDPAATVFDAAALGDLGINEAVYDYYVDSTFQIQNLDPNAVYDLTFFGSHKFNSNNTTAYTVYDDDTFTNAVASTTLLVGVNADHNEDSTATLSGIAPQSNGIIYVGFAGDGGTGSGYLNAMKVELVPEPGSMALLSLGALAIAARPRRNP